MELNLEESVIAQSKEDELVRIMDKIFNERCGFRLKFEVSYREPEESKYKEEDEKRIQKLVDSIADKVNLKGEDVQAEAPQPSIPSQKQEEKPKPAESTPQPKKKFEKQSFQSNKTPSIRQKILTATTTIFHITILYLFCII